MIAKESRTQEWIKKVSSENHAPDVGLVEKSIRAFSLLESLALSGMDFIFKGGTSLMLHFNSSRRLSIDIDIIGHPGVAIEKYLREYSREYGFTDVKLVERVNRTGVPKTHAKYYYQVSYIQRERPENILLDVLYEDVHYSNIEQIPIRSPFLKTEGEDIPVKVPGIPDLLGDKLTAFAPHTTGIPFMKGNKNCSMEIIKQLFDIASLFDAVEDISTVGDTYRRLAAIELEYRGLSSISIDDVLSDTIEAAKCVASNGLGNQDEFSRYLDGVGRVRNFIHSEKYTMRCATRDAAKVAYLAICLLQGKTSLEKFDKSKLGQIADCTITDPSYSAWNSLKKSDVTTFYYWCKTLGIC